MNNIDFSCEIKVKAALEIEESLKCRIWYYYYYYYSIIIIIIILLLLL